MYMQDWINKLDDFLRLSEREILEHVGKISLALFGLGFQIQCPHKYSRTNISAICTALVAAPLRTLSATTQRSRPLA